MNLTESFLTALDSITANKLRSVLTMLGRDYRCGRSDCPPGHR